MASQDSYDSTPLPHTWTKSLSVTMEEEESTIQDIVTVASSYVPEYDVEKIYAVMNQATGKSAAVK